MNDRADNPSSLLAVRDLAVSFPNAGGPRIQAVDGVSFTVYPRQTLAIVGESGSGKSVSALAMMRLLPTARIDRGSAVLRCKDGRELNLLSADAAAMRDIRGNEAAMIFQEPMTSLNPVEQVGEQIAEAVRLHTRAGHAEARQRAIAAMRDVGITNPEARYRQYPHEFSGGMRQRIMIAIALACGPGLLFADEPTTALDVTIQAQVLDLIGSLRTDRGLGVVLITHDLGVVAQHADVVCVMYAGRVVEYATVEMLFAAPRHPYTRGLLACIPRMDQRRERLATVREYVERTEDFVIGGAPGLTPWWPWRDGHVRSGYALMEAAPGHWVGAWDVGGARVGAGDHPAPDLPYWRAVKSPAVC
ncbi:MAG TPA: ABC transporter ATP-binding protein [Phycisphaerales bacterium]|nr:ABC transporter ATP-binding protein [Phycisphaerales bacterium]